MARTDSVDHVIAMLSYLKTKLKEIDNYVFFRVKNTRPFFLPKKIIWPHSLNFSEWKSIHLVFKLIITFIYLLLLITSILLIIIWGAYLYQAFLILPDIIVSPDKTLGLKTLIDAGNFWRLIVAVIAILAAPLTIWRLIISERQVRIARESHFTDSFTRAVDQLGKEKKGGSPNIEVRLGGIYGLERVASDSPRYHWPIMETLMAYIRQNPMKIWKEAQEPPQTHEAISIDIQAALRVIGRRSDKHRNEEDQRLNLSETNLEHANLQDAHLENAILFNVHLKDADLRDADFTGAYLKGANFRVANLKGANFFKADLENADLREATLCGTKAALAKNLTQEQINIAFGDAATTLPNNLIRHRLWSDKELDPSDAESEWQKWLKSPRPQE